MPEPGPEMLANFQLHTMLPLEARKKQLKIFCFYEENVVLGLGLYMSSNSYVPLTDGKNIACAKAVCDPELICMPKQPRKSPWT